MSHPLAKLAATIDWRFLEGRFGAVYSDKAGHPPLPTRLMAGLAILKSMHDLSDEDLSARWVENPYFQLFCGEEFFQHETSFDRSSLTRWRQRMGGEKLASLIQESLRGDPHRRGEAVRLHPRHRRRDRAAKGGGVPDRRQAHAPGAGAAGQAREESRRAIAPVLCAGGKGALIAHQRYAHAKQFKRQPGAEDDTHLPRPGLPRPRPQDG